MVIFLGYKTTSRSETPEVVYIGQSKSDGIAASEKTTFPRIEYIAHPTAFPHRGWTPDRAAAHAQAETAAAEKSSKKKLK